MNDPIKNNAIAQEFFSTDVEKIPVNILKNKNSGILHFNIAFANFEILGAHLLKSDEWIFGIYYGGRYYGYIYEGGILTNEQQFACVQDFLPEDESQLSVLQKKWENKVHYHKSGTDSFKIIGEYNGTEILQKPKKLNDTIT